MEASEKILSKYRNIKEILSGSSRCVHEAKEIAMGIIHSSFPPPSRHPSPHTGF